MHMRFRWRRSYNANTFLMTAAVVENDFQQLDPSVFLRFWRHQELFHLSGTPTDVTSAIVDKCFISNGMLQQVAAIDSQLDRASPHIVKKKADASNSPSDTNSKTRALSRRISALRCTSLAVSTLPASLSGPLLVGGAARRGAVRDRQQCSRLPFNGIPQAVARAWRSLRCLTFGFCEPGARRSSCYLVCTWHMYVQLCRWHAFLCSSDKGRACCKRGIFDNNSVLRCV